MDYYQILGLSKTATAEEISKSFRQKAVQFHPDKNPDNPQAAEEFKKCSEAYEVLGDPDRRKKYDQFGSEPPPRPRPRPSNVHRDFFTQFFEEVERKVQHGKHVVVPAFITLEEVLTGTTTEVTIKKKSLCMQCDGSGGEETICQRCDGRGGIRIAGAGVEINRPCPKCGGKGKVVISKCPMCDGGLVNSEAETVMVSVPPGIEDGMQLMFRGHGEPGLEGGRPGNLVVLVKVKQHPFFERLKRGDVLIKAPVSYAQLVLGDEVEVPSLAGGRLAVKIPPRTESGQRLKLGGQGLPQECASNGTKVPISGYGDLYVELRLELPQVPDPEYLELVEKLVKFDTLSNHPRKRELADYLTKERHEPTDSAPA